MPLTSWLQFDSNHQTVYGVAVSPYYNSSLSSPITYQLTAYDSAGLSVSTALSVTVHADNLVQVSHTFSMTIRTDYRLFTYRLSHLVYWIGNLTDYFSTTRQSITVLGLLDSSVTVEWTNNTINSVDPPYTCPLDLIYNNYQQLESGGLKASLNQYLIESVTLSLQGVCEGFTLPTTTLPTTPKETTTTVARTTTSTAG